MQQLNDALNQLSIDASEEQKKQWSEYLNQLYKWNKTYNLTAIQSLDAMYLKHLYDSLSIAPFIQGKMIIDVGTGAGLPGIPLAILYPEKTFILIDSVGKKVQFLHHIKRQLNLTNIVPYQIRIESYKPSGSIDTIVSRAFADFDRFQAITQHLITPEKTRLLGMTGQKPNHVSPYAEYYPIEVPFLEQQRHVIITST